MTRAEAGITPLNQAKQMAHLVVPVLIQGGEAEMSRRERGDDEECEKEERDNK